MYRPAVPLRQEGRHDIVMTREEHQDDQHDLVRSAGRGVAHTVRHAVGRHERRPCASAARGPRAGTRFAVEHVVQLVHPGVRVPVMRLAIVDEQNPQTVAMERRRQGNPVRSIAGVPVEDQNDVQ